MSSLMERPLIPRSATAVIAALALTLTLSVGRAVGDGPTRAVSSAVSSAPALAGVGADRGSVVRSSALTAPQFYVATQYPVPEGALDPDSTVAAVDGRGIPRAEFDHWLAVAARGKKPSVATPSPGESSYNETLVETMGFLLSSAWIEQQAVWSGIAVTPAEVRRQLVKDRREQFKSAGAFRRFLRRSGETMADVDLRVRQSLLQQRIQKLAIGNARGSQAERAALAAFIQRFERRLRPLTDCAAGFVVQDCASYKTPAARPAPRAAMP
jgi:hypothetical protein